MDLSVCRGGKRWWCATFLHPGHQSLTAASSAFITWDESRRGNRERERGRQMGQRHVRRKERRGGERRGERFCRFVGWSGSILVVQRLNSHPSLFLKRIWTQGSRRGHRADSTRGGTRNGMMGAMEEKGMGAGREEKTEGMDCWKITKIHRMVRKVKEKFCS